MERRKDRWKDGRKEKQKKGWMERWKEGKMEGRKVKWKEGRTDRQQEGGKKGNKAEMRRKERKKQGDLKDYCNSSFTAEILAMSQDLLFPVLPQNHQIVKLLRGFYDILTLSLMLQKRKLRHREKGHGNNMNG